MNSILEKKEHQDKTIIPVILSTWYFKLGLMLIIYSYNNADIELWEKHQMPPGITSKIYFKSFEEKLEFI